jgi:hypothetical protein
VLAEWSAVSAARLPHSAASQQMAFLINAYNGFTLELILTQYPNLKSIKDLGSFVHRPWKKSSLPCWAKRHLDWIEHEQLRPQYALARACRRELRQHWLPGTAA